MKLLNFELLRQVRGQNASFLGADFSRAFKTMIFGLLGGSGAVSGSPGGTYGGRKLKLPDFELLRQVRGQTAPDPPKRPKIMVLNARLKSASKNDAF